MKIKILSNRLSIIKKECFGKDVLDIGCIDHLAYTEKNDYWLHKNIKNVAKNLTGLDIAKDQIPYLNNKGYNIIYGNAEDFSLNKKFDVIVASEIIEHLSNVGNFLECIKQHLKEDGVIIITTPNSFAFRYNFRNLFFGNFVPNDEHTCYYDIYTLNNLMKRHELNISNCYYYQDKTKSKHRYYLEYIISKVRESLSPRILIIIKNI